MLLIPQFRLKHRLNALRTATTLSLPSSSLGERTLNSELNAQSFQPNQFPPHRRKTLFDCTTDIVIVPRTRCFRSEPAPPPTPTPLSFRQPNSSAPSNGLVALIQPLHQKVSCESFRRGVRVSLSLRSAPATD